MTRRRALPSKIRRRIGQRINDSGHLRGAPEPAARMKKSVLDGFCRQPKSARDLPQRSNAALLAQVVKKTKSWPCLPPTTGTENFVPSSFRSLSLARANALEKASQVLFGASCRSSPSARSIAHERFRVAGGRYWDYCPSRNHRPARTVAARAEPMALRRQTDSLEAPNGFGYLPLCYVDCRWERKLRCGRL
jgi:hypothetical protein